LSAFFFLKKLSLQKNITLKIRIISCLLLACLALPVASLYVWLQFKKGIAKKEAKKHLIQGLEKHELTLLKFTQAEMKSQVRWEHAHEFEYKKQMYDVVKVEVKNDTMYYWCWLDSPETAIQASLEALTKQFLAHDTTQQEKQKEVLKFYGELFWVGKITFLVQSFTENTIHHSLYKCVWLKRSDVPCLPPPKPQTA
jgi:hypothetical protein